MLDFKALNDPIAREKARLQREAEAAQREKVDALHRRAVEVCRLNMERLSEAERSLVRSCQERIALWLPLSDKQAKWLLDISKRYQAE